MRRNNDFLPTVDPKSLPQAITPLTPEQKEQSYKPPREPGSDDEPVTEEHKYD